MMTVNHPGQDEKVNTEGKVAYETEDTGADEDVDKADQSETDQNDDSQISTMMDIYSHVTPALQQEADAETEDNGAAR